MAKVNLSELVEAYNGQGDEFGYYLDTATGEVLLLEDSLLGEVEDNLAALLDPTVSDLQIEELIDTQGFMVSFSPEELRRIARAYDETLTKVRPPDSREDYRIMEDFVRTIDDGQIKDDIIYAMSGRGAFRRFKDKLYSVDLLGAYFDFREKALFDFAREWCEYRGLEYEGALETGKQDDGRQVVQVSQMSNAQVASAEQAELETWYQQYRDKIGAFGLFFKAMEFDQATIAPKEGLPYTNRMMSTFQDDYFSYATDPAHIAKIEALFAATEDATLKRELSLRLRGLNQIAKLPKELYLDYQNAVVESQQCWEAAKAANDYAAFKPHLLGLIEKKKACLTYFDTAGSDYDFLLDEYEMGMTAQAYDAFFARIKEHLAPLIARIRQSGVVIDDAALHQDYDLAGQKAFTKVIKAALQFDPARAYLAESVHPFCTFYSGKDVRMTTKYEADNVTSSAMSVAHEYGHALYGLQVNPDYENTTLADDIGSAMHESQSRLIENHIGRSKAFWVSLYPKLQELFPGQLAGVDLDGFITMLNRSKPGLIRIEADELTYPLHILIRYEIEREIFDGQVDLDQLDLLWADKYEQYLGVRPATHSEGIMQDVHWSCAYYGYFPTYALGSAFAAQFYHAMRRDIDVDAALLEGRFEEIAAWLAEHVHTYGARYSFDEVLVKATGESFNPDYYIDYLVDKYTKLYQLD